MNKSCYLDKNFLFLKKKVVSLKKTKICRIFKTNREIFLPVHSPNLYGISIWKMHGRSHGNFFICFGDFQQQCSAIRQVLFLRSILKICAEGKKKQIWNLSNNYGRVFEEEVKKLVFRKIAYKKLYSFAKIRLDPFSTLETG